MKKIKRKTVVSKVSMFPQSELPDELIASCPICKLQFMFSADLGDKRLVFGCTVCGRVYESVNGFIYEIKGTVYGII